ncbi:hypothetical protein SAMN05216431_104159 [Ligilactobacillus sp. WC1T17]|uniref:Uncharacterized protein n=1 Tax=Ligilactobacillus ruminis TaxID=1623 RepID=A0ABY1AAW8_9LACO|nr:hypothetical protein SAMN05216431_104159 [Ligilactobacillus ruminis]
MNKDDEREFFDQEEQPLRRRRPRKKNRFFFASRPKEVADEPETLHRTRSADDFKVQRLKKRLNRAIIVLIAAIILVYLFMRFVNF